MTPEDALQMLRDDCHSGDTEGDHGHADDILCDLIRSNVEHGGEIVEAFEKVHKWYA